MIGRIVYSRGGCGLVYLYAQESKNLWKLMRKVTLKEEKAAGATQTSEQETKAPRVKER